MINLKFTSLTFEQKIAVKDAGRSTPLLIINEETKCKNRVIHSNFNKIIYEKNDRLCDCDKTNKLYRFPCIIFNLSTEMPLCRRLPTSKIKLHEQFQAHVNAEFKF